jgi:hypothetical protein
LVTAAERYSVLRRFSPRFLTAFRFESNVPHDPVLAAIELLKAMDRDGDRTLIKRPPASFLPSKWRKLIFANSVPNRRLYEVAVLATLRERLRGSDIWIAGSRDYRAFEDYLVSAEAARHSGIGQETDPARFMKARAAALHERLKFVMARAASGELDGVEIEDGTLYIARIKPAVPEAARDLAIRLNSMLPRVRITEVLSDVADQVVITDAVRRVGHAGEAKIGAVCEDCGQQRRLVCCGVAGAQMREAVGESCPGVGGAVARQRRQLHCGPRRDRQRAPQESDGGDLG